jgi:ornithine carbamoyltransferase
MNAAEGSLLSILDLDRTSLSRLVERGLELTRRCPTHRASTAAVLPPEQLSGKSVGLVFTKPSTRTRTSFFWAVTQMGGHCLAYDGGGLQLGNGESLEDTALAMTRHLDAIVVRTNGPPAELERLRDAGEGMPVINAMCYREHPTQTIADLVTLRQEFSSLDGLHLLYVGLPCNTMNSLVLGCALLGVRMTALNPAAGPDDAWLRDAVARVDRSGVIRFARRWEELEAPVDAVYATRWESMGHAPDVASWRELRAGFVLDEARVARLLTPRGVVLHDLPATRGGEVTDAVLDGARSRIRAQAFNKGISAAVALERALPSSAPR